MNLYSKLAIFYQNSPHVCGKLKSFVTVLAQNTCLWGDSSMLQLDWTSRTTGQKINLPTNRSSDLYSETTIRKVSVTRIYCTWEQFFGKKNRRYGL